MADIFLSYSSRDRESVRPVRDALVAMGYDVFWDIETPAGANWDQWLRENIANAKVMIVFWTKNSAASLNVQHEAAIAREDSKLIPVQLEVMKAIDFPMGFYTMQAPQLNDWTGQATHAGYASMMQAVRKRFEGSPAQVVAIARDEDAADIAWLRKRAEAGDAFSQMQLGYRYVEGLGVPRDAREAVRLTSLAAAQGQETAQYNLALMHDNGEGVEQDDNEAVRLYRLAASKGYLDAFINLGIMYEQGRGVATDYVEAVRLYTIAADQGRAGGQNNLARMYESGCGVERSYEDAIRLYTLAAEQGLAAAQRNLGEMYEYGFGVDEDLSEAIRLYELAAVQGDTYAIAALERLGDPPTSTE